MDDPATIDLNAVARLRSEIVDWRFKAIPANNRTVAELLADRPGLFTDGFLGPILTIDADALRHNVETMAAWCAHRGMALAPHGKTTMAPQLFARQLDAGAWAMTAANISQIRVYRAFGVSRIALANEIIDPAGLRWLAEQLDADPNFEFSCWVDSVRGVELMDATLRERAPSRPVDVLIEVGGRNARAGVRESDEALRIAEAVRNSRCLRLVGVGGYEGAIGHGTSAESVASVETFLGRIRELTVELAKRDFFADLDQVIVTAGGSAFFDTVADVLGEPWPDGLPVLPLLRSGAYITHDDGFYRSVSPLRAAGADALRPALHIWAQVTSLPQPDQAILTMGKRDASFDEGLPEPQLLRGEDGVVTELTGHVTRKLNDQHCFLTLPAGSPVRVGDWVRFGVSHPCTVFDKWPLIPVVDAEHIVVDLIRTFF
ncbi:MAG TPA: amino acid deaminase [Pseudonocardiaceae bacterium]|jgi:D-serine deaminase-like pyridoxal phosphate-dependent protein|nr:amino acid deaminase [Pseudonocardiaceae bacterium]